MKNPWTPLVVLISTLSTTIATSSSTKSNEAACTVPSNGFETIDDAPAINDALSTCGAGGTIILPQNYNYSLHTSLNFQSCRGCTLQIEGRLFIFDVLNVRFNLRNARDVTIKSLTGEAFIDGNAYAYWFSRWDSGNVSTDTLFDIANANNITIDNLAVKDPKQRFFRAVNSTNLSFSNLKLDIYGQWGEYPRNAVEVAGIEIGNSSYITISDISMTFREREGHRGPVGFCIPFDIGSQNIIVKNIICNGAVSGVVVNTGSIVPWLSAQPISNISIYNVIFDQGIHLYDTSYPPTGFLNEWTGTLIPISDVSWDNVTAVNTDSGAIVFNCYQKIRGMTSYYYYCRQSVQVNITNAWFRNYRGAIGGPPTAEVTNNMTVIDLHVEGWGVERWEGMLWSGYRKIFLRK